MFRYIRIAILLTILLVVAGNQFLTGHRLSSWEKPLWVTVYPVLAETGADIRRYAESLEEDSFKNIGIFLQQQASTYGRSLETPVIIQVARPLTELPPALPTENSGWRIALWSLNMRWWSWMNGGQDGLAPDDIRMFVLYQTPKANKLMERSVGIKNGSYGVVNAVASRQMAAFNRVLITHELLHILGASDKYDLITGQPFVPGGLADPDQSPLYPQKRAEIMGARIATSADRWRSPRNLKSCVIGAKTAAEISLL
jgi:hypothetical protein